MKTPEILFLDRVDSTNTYAKEHFSSLSDAAIVAAREQSAGRGRLGRSWIVPPGAALTATVIFKKIRQPFHAGCLTALAGLDFARKHLERVPLFFKWPNDLYVREKKLAGVLSEAIWQKGAFAGAVSGIGINLNQGRETLDRLGNPAVSLFSLTGEKVDQHSALTEFAAALGEIYALYSRDADAVIRLWIRENRLVGQNVEAVRADGTVLRGKVEAVQKDGALLFSVGGKTERFDCGDIRIDPAKIDFEHWQF